MTKLDTNPQGISYYLHKCKYLLLTKCPVNILRQLLMQVDCTVGLKKNTYLAEQDIVETFLRQ